MRYQSKVVEALKATTLHKPWDLFRVAKVAYVQQRVDHDGDEASWKRDFYSSDFSYLLARMEKNGNLDQLSMKWDHQGGIHRI